MVASFLTYIVTFGINFFLSPYIVKTIGVEAYGFVGLANNFISYAGLITIALNSLAGRFITVKIYEKDMDGANKYFSSVFISNIIIGAFLSIISIVFILFLDKIINIPKNILFDVKLLFGALFLQCIIGTVFSVFSVATFATNKLYLNSARSIESSLIRAVILILLFAFCTPRVSYLGITSLLVGFYVQIYNIYYTKKLLTEIHIKKKYFDIKAIFELISSGIWNLITRLGQLLLEGVDLLITNLFIDATTMGILAISKTIPNIILGIIGQLAGVFSPNFTILYAEKKTDELVISLKQSMKIMGVIVNIPIIILITCGNLFYSLWQPTQNSQQLQMLSILACCNLVINGSLNCIFNIFVVVNKLKYNSIAIIISGMLNIIIVFFLLKVTNWGIYAIAGVSSFVTIMKNMLFVIPYSAKCLGLNSFSFYPVVFKSIIYVFITCIIGFLVKKIIPFHGWSGLILIGLIVLFLSLIIGIYIMLDKKDRLFIIHKFKLGR